MKHNKHYLLTQQIKGYFIISLLTSDEYISYIQQMLSFVFCSVCNCRILPCHRACYQKKGLGSKGSVLVKAGIFYLLVILFSTIKYTMKIIKKYKKLNIVISKEVFTSIFYLLLKA
jgi:hypothetical protein